MTAAECCDPARYDRGECCGNLVTPPAPVDWAEVGPGLLEALEVLVAQRDAHFHTAQAWDAARSAIARAGGGGV